MLHCLLSDSAPDSPQEIASLARNQHAVAERGREPGLQLERGQTPVALTQWGLELVHQLGPIARQLDAAHACTHYSMAVEAAAHALHHPDTLASARVLRAVIDQFDGSFVAFVQAQSMRTKQVMLETPLTPQVYERFENMARSSWVAQREIEAADTLAFDAYLRAYLSAQRLVASDV